MKTNLHFQTEKLGFVNVVDAFQNVNWWPNNKSIL